MSKKQSKGKARRLSGAWRASLVTAGVVVVVAVAWLVARRFDAEPLVTLLVTGVTEREKVSASGRGSRRSVEETEVEVEVGG